MNMTKLLSHTHKAVFVIHHERHWSTRMTDWFSIVWFEFWFALIPTANPKSDPIPAPVWDPP